MCNGFVLEQVCFHVVRKLICIPELSILNVWVFLKLHDSLVLCHIKALF